MPKIFVAVDTPELSHALDFANVIAKTEAGIKLGLEFLNANGPQGVDAIRQRHPELPFFLDLKLHDIPNTVASSVRALAKLEPDYLNVHAMGGLEMMVAANDAANEEATKHNLRAPKMIAVTILTSFDKRSLELIGIDTPVDEQVLKLARLTKQAGMKGVVCSPQEIEMIRKDLGDEFVLITPGIRPAGSVNDDQKRIMTPKQALEIGATHLVIGRPITQSDDPLKAINDIYASL